MEKLRGLFWGAWGSQLNQELSVAYDLMLPQLFTTSVFPLVFKVRFIFAPLVSTRAILSTNPQKQKNIISLYPTLLAPHLHKMISLCMDEVLFFMLRSKSLESLRKPK